MTTLIEQVQAVLAPCVTGGSWYANNTTGTPVFPYIVFLRIVSPMNNSLIGPSDVQNTLFQIDIFSKSVSEMKALEDTVTNALINAPFTAIQQDQRDGYEPDIQAFRCGLDFSCWSNN